jgi:hypothetical protein
LLDALTARAVDGSAASSDILQLRSLGMGKKVKYPAKADPPHTSELLNTWTVEHVTRGKNFYIPLSIPDESTAIDDAVLSSLLQQIADVMAQTC